MPFSPRYSLSANVLNSDYAEIHLLGGPWDGGSFTLGKQFNAPDHIYPVPLAHKNPHEYPTWLVHSGLLAEEPAFPFASYFLATACEPELDQNKNVKVRYYYIYELCSRWRLAEQ